MSTQPTIDAEIARIAGSQERLITRSQLVSLGLSKHQIDGRIDRAQLHPRHRGVFLIGPPRLSPKGELVAALLATGAGAFLSHRSSLAAQDLLRVDRRRIELTVPGGRRPRRPGLIIHRTSLTPQPRDVRERFGLRYSSLPRAMIEIAPSETPEELLCLATVAVQRKMIDSTPHGTSASLHTSATFIAVPTSSTPSSGTRHSRSSSTAAPTTSL